MLETALALIATLAVLGCAGPAANKDSSMAERKPVPMQFINHAIVVPVRVNGSIEARFILDTGIGLNLITESLCKKIQCQKSGSYTGKRMSGQEVKVDLASLNSLAMGPLKRDGVKVGVFPEIIEGVDGFLSLEFFEKTPFTIDYGNNAVIVEDESSLGARKAAGRAIRTTIDRDNGSVGIKISMSVPHGPPAHVEVDTGSDSFILDERYMKRLRIKPDGPNVKRKEGKDETNHTYVRYFSQIDGVIAPAGAPEMKQENPKVMFQKIIHDGLVGHDYFKNFVVTYDLPNSQMILAKP
jgi:hypothetical protein